MTTPFGEAEVKETVKNRVWGENKFSGIETGKNLNNNLEITWAAVC